jgi:hypothetical protein
MALDVMVDFLYDEAEYWRNVAGDKRMWDQKRKSVAAASHRHTQKRVRLAKYFPDSGSSTDSHSENETEEELQDTCAHLQARDTSPSHFSQKETGVGRSKCVCLNCSSSKLVNKDCSLGVCKECCVASTSKCKLTAHRRGKPTASRLYMETLTTSELVNRTKEILVHDIEKKCSVYITYKGGTHSDLSRKVDPKLFKAGKMRQLVETYCHTANAARSFYISDITRIEEDNWSITAVPGIDFASCIRVFVKLFAEPATLPTVTSVQQFLERVDLQQYFELFKSNGFNKLDTLKYLDLSALKAMEVALGHQGKLLDHVKRITFDV